MSFLAQWMAPAPMRNNARPRVRPRARFDNRTAATDVLTLVGNGQEHESDDRADDQQRGKSEHARDLAFGSPLLLRVDVGQPDDIGLDTGVGNGIARRWFGNRAGGRLWPFDVVASELDIGTAGSPHGYAVPRLLGHLCPFLGAHDALFMMPWSRSRRRRR